MKQIYKTLEMLLNLVIMTAMCSCTKGNNDSGEGNNGGSNSGEIPVENYEYIDLGLPSGTLWATCNVGANSPEEKGDFFAWGETKTKNEFDWNNYKFGINPISKYNEQDNLSTLQMEDDAATVNWGNDWCTPSPDQWEELIRYTTGWDERHGQGVLLTASNGQSMFLPFTGVRTCAYMTCSLYPYTYRTHYSGYQSFLCYGEYAWHYIIWFDHHWELYDWGAEEYSRCKGRCVRPVRSK